MDPKNPRWESAETRVARSATLWKVIASAAAAAALTTVIVVSCLDRVGERRASAPLPEPAYVETVTTTQPPAQTRPAPATASAAPPSTADSTGGPAGTTRVTSTTMAADASADR